MSGGALGSGCKTFENGISRMDRLDQQDDIPQLLQKRHDLTAALCRSPYDAVRYLERAAVHTDLGYPDLAAGDAYRALLLTDEARDESFEYHGQARDALRSRCADGLPAILRSESQSRTQSPALSSDVDPSRGGRALAPDDDEPDEERRLSRIAHEASIQCYRRLAISLLLCGCLKSAYDFCSRGLALAPADEDLLFKKEHIQAFARRNLSWTRATTSIPVS
jgi:hypothetical protein